MMALLIGYVVLWTTSVLVYSGITWNKKSARLTTIIKQTHLELKDYDNTGLDALTATWITCMIVIAFPLILLAVLISILIDKVKQRH